MRCPNYDNRCINKAQFMKCTGGDHVDKCLEGSAACQFRGTCPYENKVHFCREYIALASWCSHTMPLPLPSSRQHLSYDVCLEVRGEIIRTVLCYIVYRSCAQS